MNQSVVCGRMRTLTSTYERVRQIYIYLMYGILLISGESRISHYIMFKIVIRTLLILCQVCGRRFRREGAGRRKTTVSLFLTSYSGLTMMGLFPLVCIANPHIQIAIYLDFSSHHRPTHKAAVVRTLQLSKLHLHMKILRNIPGSTEHY